MNVKVKKLNENAVLPYKTFDKDFCYDVVATSIEEVAPNVFKYGLGLAFQIERDLYPGTVGRILLKAIDGDGPNYGTYAYNSYVSFTSTKCLLSLDFRPRSSVWKTGLVLSNCVGTIDELYTGEVSAVFYKVAPGEIYKIGDRVGQIKLGITLPLTFIESDTLDETERGDGGYGSTGK